MKRGLNVLKFALIAEAHLTHVFWECTAFSHLRSTSVSAPENALARRLGWSGEGVDPEMISQMAQIRALECRFSLKIEPIPEHLSPPPSYEGGPAEPDRRAHQFLLMQDA